MRNTADVTGGKPIAVLLQSISGVSAINPLVAFYDIYGERERCYYFSLSRTPHETKPKIYVLEVGASNQIRCIIGQFFFKLDINFIRLFFYQIEFKQSANGNLKPWKRCVF
jgi:hypothetical protein